MVLHKPDGSEQVKSNDSDVLANYTPVGSVLRGLLITRHVGISRALYNKWPIFESDAEKLGLWTDFVHHVLLTQHVDQTVVMNCEGPVYRTGVGVTSKADFEALDRSFYAALVRIQSYHSKGELILSDVDAKYFDFVVQCWAVRIKPNTIGVLRALRAAWNLLRIRRSELSSIAKVLYRMARQIISNGFRRRREP